MIVPMAKIAAALLVLHGVGLSPAATQDKPADQTKAAPADDDNKIICKRTLQTGSKFKKKICGTKAEWEALRLRSAEATRNWQRRGKGLEPTDTNKPGG